MCKDCEFCKLMDEIEDYLSKFFKKVEDEDKAAMAGFIMQHVAIEGTDSYMESLGLFDIAKNQFKETQNDIEDEEKIIRMN